MKPIKLVLGFWWNEYCTKEFDGKTLYDIYVSIGHWFYSSEVGSRVSAREKPLHTT